MWGLCQEKLRGRRRLVKYETMIRLGESWEGEIRAVTDVRLVLRPSCIWSLRSLWFCEQVDWHLLDWVMRFTPLSLHFHFSPFSSSYNTKATAAAGRALNVVHNGWQTATVAETAHQQKCLAASRICAVSDPQVSFKAFRDPHHKSCQTHYSTYTDTYSKSEILQRLPRAVISNPTGFLSRCKGVPRKTSLC